jgi:hypothetical protein
MSSCLIVLKVEHHLIFGFRPEMKHLLFQGLEAVGPCITPLGSLSYQLTLQLLRLVILHKDRYIQFILDTYRNMSCLYIYNMYMCDLSLYYIIKLTCITNIHKLQTM